MVEPSSHWSDGSWIHLAIVPTLDKIIYFVEKVIRDDQHDDDNDELAQLMRPVEQHHAMAHFSFSCSFWQHFAK